MNIKIKFILVGIWNTIFGYFIFFVLDIKFEKIFISRFFSYMIAMILGHIISTINAFMFHKYITFKTRGNGKKTIKEFFRFCMTYLFTFVVSILLLPFFAELLHIHPRLSGALVILITIPISYIGHSKFTFGNRINLKKN